MVPTHRVQREHLRTVGALAETIHPRGGLSMAEAGPKVTCNQRRVGGLQVGADNAAPIGTSQFLGPLGVRLVF